MNQLIYVTSGDVSVYESQVIELLKYLQQIGVKVILLQGYKSEAEKSNIQKKLDNHPSIPTVWTKIDKTYRLYEHKNIKSVYESLVTIEGYKTSVFHIRNEFMGYLMKSVSVRYGLNLAMLIDIRGVIYEELVYKQKKMGGLHKLFPLLQRPYFKRCYKKLFADDTENIVITSVSSMINDYIREHYPSCRYNLIVHPNIAGKQFVFDESKRKELRERFNISDNEVLAICSTGGNSVWQKDYMVVKQLVDLGVKVINLSKNKIDVEGCYTTTIPFMEMPAVLSAGDVAVLWRDDIFMNQSASPSKYSEFATMGLYVIHNKTVKVAEEHIKKSGAGLLVNEVEDVKTLPSKEELENQRQRWIEEGLSAFGVDSLGQSYLKVYHELSGKTA